MGFFESIPQPPPPEPVRRRRPVWMRSDAVIPGLVPVEVMLAGPGGGGLFDRHWRGMRAPNAGLRLGVMYADGRRAAAPGGPQRPDDGEPGRLVLFEEPESEPDRYAWNRQVVTKGKPDDPGAKAEPGQPGIDAAGPGGCAP